MSRFTIALCGNPNSGKTTLFNRLTGANQKTGNWAGVTVERKQGAYRKRPDVDIVDTPGAYSLEPYSLDERIAAEFVTSGKPDIVINVVDATNLERNLLLTTQLLELDVPVVVALNLKDEAEKKGIIIDPNVLGQQLKCKVCYVSAAKNVGIDELMDYCLSERPIKTKVEFPSDSAKRYAKISNIVAVSRKVEASAQGNGKSKLTAILDGIALNKWLAFPVFFAVMGGIFYLSIGSVGKFLTALINEYLTPTIQSLTTDLLANANSPMLTSLICDGVIAGVMSVASFVPQIMLLFGCIAILEASGYMSRIAFITDKLLYKLGLGGRSFVSMILGCGCSVPAVMSTRTIKDIMERNTTITLTPFIPCSAKLAVISFFVAKIFGGNALIAISFYIVSIAAIILGGLILKAFNRKKYDCDDAFIMELPNYRVPSANNVIKQMWERGKAFLIKAGTVIFVASVVLWLLQSFNFRLQYVSTEDSMLSDLGKLVAPLFVPLGFADGGYGWQFSVASLTGVVAKETVVTTLEILLPIGVENCISGWGGYCFVVYNLLTAPCIATISASFAESGGFKQGAKTLLFQITAAYLITLVMYQIGTLWQTHAEIVWIFAVIVATAAALIASIKRVTQNKVCSQCANAKCSHCANNIKK